MIDLIFSAEVDDARKNNMPIVALESTIITHGMPYPQNIRIAKEVQQVVRDHGAVPATIAVLRGKLHIGLSDAQLEDLAQAQDVMKLSRADLAVALATGRNGATTVAATMIAAHLAGIPVFATGGIGGVHRGAELSFDVSADLQELAQTPVTVVAAGAKAILDIPKTLEVLETLGVPVIAFGQDTLPAFWSSTSAIPAPLRLDSPDEIAASHHMRRKLGLPGGQLIANPVPDEMQIPQNIINPCIRQALEESETLKISAKKVTPFLLSRIFELTDGKSLDTNIALVKNNAKVAAQIAGAL